MKKTTLLAWTVVIGLLLGHVSGLFAADLVQVTTPDGLQQFTGEILELNYKYVTIKSRGKEYTIYTAPQYGDSEKQKSIIVDKVTRRPKPTKFAKALGRWDSRRYAYAYEGFRESSSEVGGKFKWLGAYIYYYAGESAFKEAKYGQAQEGGKKKWYGRADDAFGKLLKRYPDHYFVPEAAVGLARAQIRLDKFDEALQTLKDIRNSDYPNPIKKQARVWQGRLMVERGRYDSAINSLEELTNRFMGQNPALAYLAMISQAYAWQGKGNYRKAENLFRTVGLRSPNDEMRAEAYNSRGLSLMKRGEIREALFSFLRVVVLHPDIRNEYQKALYYAAVTANEYYSDESGDVPQRARELAKKLKNRFPRSYWMQRLKNKHPDLLG